MEKPIPKRIKDMDFTGLIASATEQIEAIADGTYNEDNDDAHYIYEGLMEIVYGEKIWEYINKNI